MSESDENWERMLRAADPARTDAGAPLTLARQSLRDRITSGAAPVRARATRRRLWLGIAAPVVALASLVVALVVVLPLGTAPAAAYGPRPLAYQEIPLSAQEVIDQAIAQLEAPPSSVQTERRSRVTSWSLSFSPDAEPEKQLAIEPYVSEFEWREDLSGFSRTWAGTPFYADGPTGRVPDGVAHPPGELVREDRFGAGEYVAVFPAVLNEGPAKTIVQSGYLLPDARAGDVIEALANLSVEWTLSDSDVIEVLRMLTTYEGLRVRGATTDRLGHEVVALVADQVGDPTTDVTLFLSVSTGRPVGIERVDKGTNPHLPVPAGTITSYMLWGDSSAPVP